MGGEGARVEDVPQFLQRARAGKITLQHPDRQPNVNGGVNGYLSVYVSS